MCFHYSQQSDIVNHESAQVSPNYYQRHELLFHPQSGASSGPLLGVS